MTELKDLAELSKCSAGEQISFIALLTDIKLMTTSLNKDYIRLYFRDDKSAISIPMWNQTLESVQTVYSVDAIYSVVAVTDTYNNSICIKRLLSATEVNDDKINRRLRQHMFKCATEENIKIILATTKALQTTKYSPYIERIYGSGEIEDETFQSLLTAFASINHHDNYPGGLINHVGGMLHLAAFLKTKYLSFRSESQWDVDWQYITAAIMLHDIGKLHTYSKITEYTVRFKDDCLLSHNTLGVGMLYAIHESLPEAARCDYATFQHLAYTIEFHDSIDKLYEHKHLEDKLISYIDGLDATLASSCSLEA